VTQLAASQDNPDIFFDPIAAIAATSQVTQTIQLGTAVTEVLRHHPVQLAQSSLTLAHLAPGRINLGIGAGEPAKLRPFGLDFESPVSRLEEGLQIIRLLWSTTEPVDFAGIHFQLSNAALGLAPPPEGPPRLWVAAHGPRMLTLAARYGDGWLPTFLSVTDYAARLLALRAALADNGRQPDAVEAGMFAGVVVGKTRSEVSRLLASPLVRAMAITLPPSFYRERGFEPPLGDMYGMMEFDPSQISTADALKVIDRVPPEIVADTLLHGTTEDVVEQILAYHRAGLRHIVLMNQTFFADASLTRSSFEQLSEVRRLVGEQLEPAA